MFQGDQRQTLVYFLDEDKEPVGVNFTVHHQISYTHNFSKVAKGEKVTEAELIETEKSGKIILRLGNFDKDSDTIKQNKSTKLKTLTETFYLFENADEAREFVETFEEVPNPDTLLFGINKWVSSKKLQSNYEVIDV